MNIYDVHPVIIEIKNETNKEETIDFLSPKFNDFENKFVTGGYDIPYSAIQKHFLNESMKINHIRITSGNLQAMINRPIKIICRNITGQSSTTPFLPSMYYDSELQIQENIVEIEHELKIDSGTGFQVTLKPDEQIRFYLFKDPVLEMFEKHDVNYYHEKYKKSLESIKIVSRLLGINDEIKSEIIIDSVIKYLTPAYSNKLAEFERHIEFGKKLYPLTPNSRINHEFLISNVMGQCDKILNCFTEEVLIECDRVVREFVRNFREQTQNCKAN